MKKFSEICAEAQQGENIGIVYLITHDGVCHSDDLMSTALLKEMVEMKGLRPTILRTRNPKIKDMFAAKPSIVYDVFDGELDHHKEDEVVDGRILSSIGKIWRWAKEDIKELFGIDEAGWSKIDTNLIKPVDDTDNTGNMNPLNWVLNSIRSHIIHNRTTDEAFEQAFNACLDYASTFIIGAIKAEYDLIEVNELYEKLPTFELRGKTWKINDDPDIYIMGHDIPGISGYVWRKPNGTYGVRPNGWLLTIPEDNKGINFIHKGRWIAEIQSMDFLSKLM